MTPYQSYRSISWTSAEDKCEHCDNVTLNEENYVEGRYGHYCSEECLYESDDTYEYYAQMDTLSDRQERSHERRQMGIE